jgi:hypothetical protein
MLDALAGLEADGGDQITALATWQAALSREPDASMAASIMGRMRKALARALAVDDPSAVDPVTALALVGTFPTLLPASDQGHRLVDGLAARLADAGLPAQAAGLLDERRARGGPPPTAPGLLDLARYRLAADEAGAALAALARIEARAERPDAQRRLTEAQALLASGRPGDALRPLDQDAGPETSDLRALALWRLGSWGRLREELASDAGGSRPSTGCKFDRL